MLTSASGPLGFRVLPALLAAPESRELPVLREPLEFKVPRVLEFRASLVTKGTLACKASKGKLGHRDYRALLEFRAFKESKALPGFRAMPEFKALPESKGTLVLKGPPASRAQLGYKGTLEFKAPLVLVLPASKALRESLDRRESRARRDFRPIRTLRPPFKSSYQALALTLCRATQRQNGWWLK
jgi:hypothetical protein